MLFTLCQIGAICRILRVRSDLMKNQYNVRRIMANLHNLATNIRVNIGSVDDLVPDGTKLPPKAMLTFH